MPIFLYILSIIVLISIISFIVYIKQKKNKNNINIKIKDKIKTIIAHKEGFENYITIFDIFKESYGTFILNKIIDDNKKHRDLRVSDHVLSTMVKKELSKKETIALLGDAYIEWISNNIQEAENIEEKAIEYHRSFGIEPNGDPELHIRESINTNTEEEKYNTIDELIKTGTIEEIE